MVAGDKEHDCLAAPFVADMEVTEAAEVAKGDAAVAIEMVAANAVIDLRPSQTRRGFETSMESLQWRAAVEGSVGTLLVVDGAEGIKLQLKVSDGLGRCLFGEEELQGLVEAFDLCRRSGGDRARSERTERPTGRARTRERPGHGATCR